MKRDFYLDVYTILNRINPRHKAIPKVEKWCPRSVESSLSQMGWCIKPIKLQFQSILTRKILMLSNATNQPKSTVDWTLGDPWSKPSNFQKLKYEKRLLLRCIHHFKWCIKRIKLQFQSILTRKILMLSNATNQPKSKSVELKITVCPRGLWSMLQPTNQPKSTVELVRGLLGPI